MSRAALSFLAFTLLVSESYLDLHTVAHVDGDGVAAVHSGVKGGAGLWRCFDVTFWPSHIELAGHCQGVHKKTPQFYRATFDNKTSCDVPN